MSKDDTYPAGQQRPLTPEEQHRHGWWGPVTQEHIPPTPAEAMVLAKLDEIIALLKQTLQAGQETLGSVTDAQLLEQVKFPFGDRMVTRFTFWMGPLYQFRNHHGQLVVYLRLNGIVPPTTARRPA